MLRRLGRQILNIAIFVILLLAIWYRFDIYEILLDIEVLSYITANFAIYIKVIFFIYLASVALEIFLHNENPASTMSWILVFIASPIFGYIAYLTFGRSFDKRKKRKTWLALKELDKSMEKFFSESQSFKSPYYDVLGEESQKLSELLSNNSRANLSFYNDTKIYLEGESQFDDMISDIENAKESIHVEYFIIKNDSTGEKFFEVLCKKAKEGVSVKLIYDDIGSFAMDENYINKMKEAGAEVKTFLPVLFPRFAIGLNHRNHRKIVVIDNDLAYIGGMNIGDYYRNINNPYRFWRDTHLRIEGDAVISIQKCFIQDWIFVTKKSFENHAKYFEKEVKLSKLQNKNLKVQPMQIVPSGPDSKWQSIMQAYFSMICSAKKSIKITTPYLVPDASIMEALKTAALSGVRVDIVVPAEADHFFVYWSTRSNFEQLMKAGVNIHEYQKGFMHSKGIVIDGKISSVGTANFDIRSLKLNFEINSFIYDEELSKKIEEAFDEDIKNSIKVDENEYSVRPFWQKLLESLGKLVSPLQ